MAENKFEIMFNTFLLKNLKLRAPLTFYWFFSLRLNLTSKVLLNLLKLDTVYIIILSGFCNIYRNKNVQLIMIERLASYEAYIKLLK